MSTRPVPRGLSKVAVVVALLLVAAVGAGAWYAASHLFGGPKGQPHLQAVASAMPASTAVVVSVADPLALMQAGAAWMPRELLDDVREEAGFDPMLAESWEQWVLDPNAPAGYGIVAERGYVVVLASAGFSGADDAAVAALTAALSEQGELDLTVEARTWDTMPGLLVSSDEVPMPAAVWLRSGRVLLAVAAPLDDDEDRDWVAIYEALAAASRATPLTDDETFAATSTLGVDSRLALWVDPPRLAPSLRFGFIDVGPAVADFAPLVMGVEFGDERVIAEYALVLEEASTLLAAYDREADLRLLRRVPAPVIYGSLSNVDMLAVWTLFDSWVRRSIPLVNAVYAEAVDGVEDEMGVEIATILGNLTGTFGNFVHSYDDNGEAAEMLAVFGVVDEAVAIGHIQSMIEASGVEVGTRTLGDTTVWSIDDGGVVAEVMVYDGAVWLDIGGGDLDGIHSGDLTPVLDDPERPWVRRSLSGGYGTVMWADASWFDAAYRPLAVLWPPLEHLDEAVQQMTGTVRVEGARITARAELVLDPAGVEALRQAALEEAAP